MLFVFLLFNFVLIFGQNVTFPCFFHQKFGPFVVFPLQNQSCENTEIMAKVVHLGRFSDDRHFFGIDLEPRTVIVKWNPEKEQIEKLLEIDGATPVLEQFPMPLKTHVFMDHVMVSTTKTETLAELAGQQTSCAINADVITNGFLICHEKPQVWNVYLFLIPVFCVLALLCFVVKKICSKTNAVLVKSTEISKNPKVGKSRI
uniref:Uncharacterized protein n=1 Tax=Panagrolaimus sp. JU765 TaxID=591449 RepID=A0AC34R764_9BILA